MNLNEEGNVAYKLFKESLDWLRENYGSFTFFTERDLEWMLQTHIADEITQKNLPYRIFNDWPIERGKKYADLVIRSTTESDEFKVEVAIEIKYEPDHKRKDFRKKKLESPIVSWSDNTNQSSVTGDVKRIKTFVEADRAVTGYAIFIDEGSYFRNKKKMPDGCEWYDKFGRTSGALLIFKNG